MKIAFIRNDNTCPAEIYANIFPNDPATFARRVKAYATNNEVVIDSFDFVSPEGCELGISALEALVAVSDTDGDSIQTTLELMFSGIYKMGLAKGTQEGRVEMIDRATGGR